MERAAEFVGISSQTLLHLITSAAIVLVALVLRLFLSRLIANRVRDANRRYASNKALSGALGVVAVLALVLTWTRGGVSFAAYLGIVSAGLAIALQDLLGNLAGWVFILVRRPFAIGDRIEIGAHRGDVVDVRLFQFSLIEIGNWVNADQSTGRIIHIPNGWVFRLSTANYTQGFNFIWDEVAVTVTFESDWRKAKEVLGSVAQEVSIVPSESAVAQLHEAGSRYRVQYQHLTPIVWTSVADIGVTLTMRYLCEPRRRRRTQEQVWELVLDAFAACPDIDFAYPTTRFYDNRAEGKPGAGATATE